MPEPLQGTGRDFLEYNMLFAAFCISSKTRGLAGPCLTIYEVECDQPQNSAQVSGCRSRVIFQVIHIWITGLERGFWSQAEGLGLVFLVVVVHWSCLPCSRLPCSRLSLCCPHSISNTILPLYLEPDSLGWECNLCCKKPSLKSPPQPSLTALDMVFCSMPMSGERKSKCEYWMELRCWLFASILWPFSLILSLSLSFCCSYVLFHLLFYLRYLSSAYSAYRSPVPWSKWRRTETMVHLISLCTLSSTSYIVGLFKMACVMSLNSTLVISLIHYFLCSWEK